MLSSDERPEGGRASVSTLQSRMYNMASNLVRLFLNHVTSLVSNGLLLGKNISLC